MASLSRQEAFYRRFMPPEFYTVYWGAPVNFSARLPNELLESIFILCACSHFWSDPHSEDHPPTHIPDWVYVSHVSSRWRNVALNSATLWSYIFATSQPWIDTLLERSRQAPLKICIHVESYRDSRSLDFSEFLNHAARISGLRFFTRDWDTEISDGLAALCSRASRLQMLELSMDYGSWPFNEEARLVPWDGCKLGGLTTLSLCFIPTYYRQDVLKFQAMLEGIPHLRNLYLHSALATSIDFISSAGFKSLRKINLPLLSRLLLAAPVYTIVAFFAAVNIPANTHIRLDCIMGDTNASIADYNQLCSVLAKHYSNDRAISRPAIRTVIMSFYVSSTLAFITSLEPADQQPCLDEIPFEWDPNIFLEITIGQKALDKVKVESIICACLPTADVQALIVVCPPSSPNFWKEVSGYYPRLRQVRIRYGTMEDGLVPIFLPQPDGHMWAPALEALEFHDTIFRKPKAPHQVSISKSDLELLPYQELYALCTALSSRKGSRGRLTIVGCSLTDELGTLHDMVGEWEEGRFSVISVRHYVDPIEATLFDGL